MNTDNLNRSQIITMSRRVYAAINNLKEQTFYEKRTKHNYLFNLQRRLDLLERDIWIDNNLCAYCKNHIDHNLGDHKLAIERQKITDRINANVNQYLKDENLEDDFEAFYREWF
jgi:hypothetical protein